MGKKRRLSAWSFLALATLAFGCGPQTDRLGISGQVRLDGAPLDEGSIRFTSRGDTPMAAGALVREGRFQIPAEKGLLPGDYAVVIRSPDNDAPKILYEGFPTAPDRVPSQYNAESTLTANVARGEENRFEFELTSAKP
ncbi:hypothetical protein [Botrimarina mediterranea]|uniref:Carboxypeptidase regulatory-like domain-containing protein n=1 Tax=Botrimarina mediterranea TaxID=2528022 RepID=A0A518KA98_9BACT|nr:hypothetical protein [Botrimarina mediterranea]QDV74708.1 hypothetical protein Spa11_29160 [Botrimarina mediterranea]